LPFIDGCRTVDFSSSREHDLIAGHLKNSFASPLRVCYSPAAFRILLAPGQIIQTSN
jgi:hypothetical protein